VRAATVVIALLLASAVLAADDRTVLFDDEVNFSSFKTFTLHDGTVSSQRPELKSSITRKKLSDAIRGALTARGLKETADPADLLVEHSVNAVDYGIGPFGRANPIGGRGRRGDAQGSTVDFTEATLVVDLKAGDPRALVWRGVFRQAENDAGKLAEALPKFAASLLSDYPPRKK
jgi:hypothetical protein